MLVFQRDFQHIIDNWQTRVGLPVERLIEIVTEINLYLPDDWRMTRSENNFGILAVEENAVLQGWSYISGKEEEILNIIDTIFAPYYFDSIEIKKIANGDHDLKDVKRENPQLLSPNLYYFKTIPDNFKSPLFARQYEKVLYEDGNKSRFEYHRIHQLTKAGLDAEHFRWVRWDSIEGRLYNNVETINDKYHGKSYWIIKSLISESKRAGRKEYVESLINVQKQYKIKPFARPESLFSRYEIEFKLLLLSGHDEYDTIHKRSLDLLTNNGFTVVTAGKQKNQKDVYFDDDEYTLHSSGISFRIRKKQQDNKKVTIKKRLPYMKGYSENGLYERIEEEATISNAQYKDLYAGKPLNVLPYRLLSYVASSLDHDSFKPVCIIKNLRTSVVIEDENHRKAEISFDRVTYSVNSKKLPYFEIEIESKGMPREITEQISRILEKGLGAIISEQSKYERGISLYRTMREIRSEKESVIIDVDCGVDDALALILALRSTELQVLAITTVAGNVSEEKVAKNVFKIFQALGLKHPPVVARGATRPFNIKRDARVADSVHGIDGLGDSVPASDSITTDQRPAWELICDLADTFPDQITVITLGPMTNLAHGIVERPASIRNLKRIVSMGGVFSEIGNVGADAEFNIGADPDAAGKVVDFCRNSCLKTPHWKHSGKRIDLPNNPQEADYQKIIIEYNEENEQERTIWDWNDLVEYRERIGDERKGMVPLTFVGLDVTHKVVFRQNVLHRAIDAHPDNDLLKFVRDISKKYMEFYYSNEKLPGCYMHDPLTVAYVINPSLLEVEEHIIRVETKGEMTTGVMFPDDRPTRNPAWRNPAEAVIGIARKVEREAFEEFFIKMLI